MTRYGEKDHWFNGYTLKLRSGVVVSFFEEKGAIGMSMSDGERVIKTSMSGEQWTEMCDLRYNLSPKPMTDADKFEKVLDEVKEADDGGDNE
jgi:hypothetical protein